MEALTFGSINLQLLPQRAVYIDSLKFLMVSDVHLGKSETFQHYGIPVPSLVNDSTLSRLAALCSTYEPETLWILGDLFHARAGMTDGVIDSWLNFLNRTQVSVSLILGNHDRALVDLLQQLSIQCFFEAVDTAEGVLLSHEPYPQITSDQINLCGHVHPCINLQAGGDRLRLPCFYWEPQSRCLTLPAFGDFTGGYQVALKGGAVAYGIAEDQVVQFTEQICASNR